MNPVTEGQAVYGWTGCDVRPYWVRKVTGKMIRAEDVQHGYSRTFRRHDGFPSGAVGVYRDSHLLWTTEDECALAEVQSGAVGVYRDSHLLWTTEDECALAEVQRLNTEINSLRDRAKDVTEKYLGGEE